MKNVFARTLMLTMLTATVLTACEKEGLPKPVITPPVDDGYFTVKLKAAITVGDVVYDSIPATFTITSWDANGVQHQKDTTLQAGAQAILLPKAHSRYAFSVNKWGVHNQLVLTKNEVTEGHTYTLSGSKAAKKLQSVTQYAFVNGAFVPSQRQVFAYDAQGRIKHIDQYGVNEQGALSLGSRDEFIYDGNQLKVENVNVSGGPRTVWFHHAYTFDAQGRAIQSEYRYITEHHLYTNQYTSDGINMLMGAGTEASGGSRIALKFASGNRVEEKTVIPNHANTVKYFTYDANINPYAVIKMPSLYFEMASKNNVLTEGWEGRDAIRKTYSYDAEGYVTEVLAKGRNNNGEYVNTGKTVYTY